MTADEKGKHIEFVPSGRGKARCATNPDYPNGIDLDRSYPGEPSCTVGLPYPAPECGTYLIDCMDCNLMIAVTAVGRPDDPRTVKLPCLERAG
jgi:hypothetical protein